MSIHILNLAGTQAVKSVVTWTIGFIMGTLIMGNVKRLLHRNLKVQEQIADQLDTTTPGGLTDLVEAVERGEK